MVNIVGKEVDVTHLISANRGVDGKLKSKPTIVKKFGEPRDYVISTAESCHIPPNITHIIIDGKKYAILGQAYNLSLTNSELIVSYTKENDIGKEECEKYLVELVKEWKVQTIDSSPKLSAWCKLNDKKPEDVDLEELEKMFPNRISIASSGTISLTNGGSISSGHTHTMSAHTHTLNTFTF